MLKISPKSVKQTGQTKVSA